MSRWILTDSVVPWDSKNQFYAFFRFLAASIQDGVLPFWNPYHYGGHPSVADPQSLIFAPAFVLWALFDPAPSLRTFDLLVHAHLLIGGLCGRRHRRARGLAGRRLRAGGGGVHVRRRRCRAAAAHRHHRELRSVPAGAAAAAARAASAARMPSPSLLLFVAAAVALGRNQVALLLCFVLVAVAIAEVIARAERPLRYLRERFSVLAVMALIGRCADCRADDTDHAVCGAVEPSGGDARRGAIRLAAPGWPRAACRSPTSSARTGPTIGVRTASPSRWSRSPTTVSAICSWARSRWCCCCGSASPAAASFAAAAFCWRRSRCWRCCMPWAATPRCSPTPSSGCRA